MWIISMNALVRALDTNYPQAPAQDRLEGTEGTVSLSFASNFLL
jgi:hypothetical protein